MERKQNVQLMQGNEAVVEGAIAAGVRFFAGYPLDTIHRNTGGNIGAHATGGWCLYPDGR